MASTVTLRVKDFGDYVYRVNYKLDTNKRYEAEMFHDKYGELAFAVSCVKGLCPFIFRKDAVHDIKLSG